MFSSFLGTKIAQSSVILRQTKKESYIAMYIDDIGGQNVRGVNDRANFPTQNNKKSKVEPVIARTLIALPNFSRLLTHGIYMI
jgi:16S rRNA G527 N7-methylase RsmG